MKKINVLFMILMILTSSVLFSDEDKSVKENQSKSKSEKINYKDINGMTFGELIKFIMKLNQRISVLEEENRSLKEHLKLKIGQWISSKNYVNHEAGATIRINFDSVIYNTAPNCFDRNPDNKSIVILKTGYYEIVGRTMVFVVKGDSSSLFLFKNKQILEKDHGGEETVDEDWRDRHINYSGLLKAGDILSLQVYHRKKSKLGYGGGSNSTRITIKRLIDMPKTKSIDQK